MKIVEGLHIKHVAFGRIIKLRSSDFNFFPRPDDVDAFDGLKVKSIIWQPKPENWMAAEIMRVLLTKKENE